MAKALIWSRSWFDMLTTNGSGYRGISFVAMYNKEKSDILDNNHATAQVLTSAFGDMGITRVLGPHKGFVNVDAGFLHSDLRKH